MKNQQEIMQFANRQTLVAVPSNKSAGLVVEKFVYDCFMDFLEESVKAGRCKMEPAHHILKLLDFTEYEDDRTADILNVCFLHNELHRMVGQQVVSKEFAAQVFRELVYDDGSEEISAAEELALDFSHSFMQL